MEQVTDMEGSKHPFCILAHQGLCLCCDLELGGDAAVPCYREGAWEMEGIPLSICRWHQAPVLEPLFICCFSKVWMCWL